MEVTVDVVDLVSKLLDSGNYKDALSVPNDEKYVQVFKDNSSDLISVIVQKVQDDTILVKPSLLRACEEMLAFIIQKATPEEALLEFIEQIELAKNDAQFEIILTPLQKLLKKLTNKRGRSLEWCLNSISTYIEKIPIPEHKLEGKERLLLDSDPGIRRIAKVYSLLPHFYSTFIKELSKPDSNLRYKQIIAAFLISLLGKPLIYVDMDPDINAQSEARQSCTIIISDICILEKNLLKFLEWLEYCNNQQGKSKSSETMNTNDKERSPYEHEDKINMTSLSGFFYSIFSGHFEFEKNCIPQVYSIEYIVNTTMLAVLHLLSFPEYSPICKGMFLCKALLGRLPDQTPHKLLSASVHFNLCRSLMNITIYSEYVSVRKEGLQLLSFHMNKFDYKGRCRLIQFLVKNANHSGLIGYVITQYKNSIDEGFKESIFPDCFTGAQLMSMIELFCYLPFGAESDLVELADQIISTLNILRYLALKDTQNITGIKDNFTKIESEYLDKIRTGLNMSKAHYEEKLKEIEEAREALRNGRKFVLPLTFVPVNNTQRIIRNYCQSKLEKEKSVIPIVTEQEENQYEENIKNRILEKALEFVTKNGWSSESLSAGAEAIGYPGITHGLFPNGGGDLIHYFNIKCNQQLVDQMKEWPKENLKESNVPIKFIENAILTRLLMIAPYKGTWPKAMAIQTLPNNVPNCLATLLSLVDDICYYSGDRSVDFNWYMRRVGLAGIYKTTELFYLTDNSQNNTATKSFLSSRIRDAQLVQTALNLNPVSAAPQALTAAFVTAKNILGINTVK